ncbi:lytic transglycosylase domain-containing protein [Microbacterium sp. TNHR37B]|uniref:aggregation-promoting factor C-terminal-like domain-containing protein n=1 Tax=Microbacterium sp. TNHR37B TaxID=1775956 RepID=UPI0007B1B64C|nr:lytic transglycosylase domain-containing protein [Microbacterium sp. TNHR37B]KZE91057.1 hypothetical protein AVP41_00590 [Microbacterium sp. TNHR37B]
MSVFAVFATAAFAGAYVLPLTATISPAQAAEPDPISLYASTIEDAQAYIVTHADDEDGLGRDGMNFTAYVKPKPKPTPTATRDTATGSPSGGSGSSWRPPFVTPNPGSAQAIAYEMVTARGWGDDQFACLVALWKKESGWRVNAYNRSSGAYGIPQALPGRKMASVGSDWETNPATQITWGLGYIKGRYGSPCGAWDHSQRRGWY